jgi:DNA-binding PadR family transcriptional regulator
MRHTAMVPKGFLRFYVLKLLNEKPMSGSEIMSEIDKRSGGCWKPSPGSIYPLMAWLQDKGYIKEAPASEQEAGIKRYTLTEQGKAFLEEHGKTKEELHKRFRFFGPPFMGSIWLELYPEKARELRRATKELALAIWGLKEKLCREYSEKAAEEAGEVLKEAAEKIERIAKELKE